MLMPPRTGSAAVAIIQCNTPQERYLLLRRATNPLDPWSGHFSFPGGRKEEEDKDLLATCIRETQEETGLLLDRSQLKKSLSLQPAGRNFSSPLWVQPFIFRINKPPALKLEEKEIQSSCWLDAAAFRDISLHQHIEMIPGKTFPAYSLEDYYLWGFTYRLMCLILDLKKAEK